MFSSRVDYERIKAVGPDRAAAEWLLRCGAKVRFRGFDRWQHDYNGLPTGPLGRYQIQAIDATESCIMYRGFDYLGEWRLHTITVKIPCMILIPYPCSTVLPVFFLLFTIFTIQSQILQIHPCKSQRHRHKQGLRAKWKIRVFTVFFFFFVNTSQCTHWLHSCSKGILLAAAFAV